MDVIMEQQQQQQQQELAGDRFQSEQKGDQTGWPPGRLTRQLNKAEKDQARQERINAFERRNEPKLVILVWIPRVSQPKPMLFF